MKLNFYKYHGTGNDFIILDWRYFNFNLSKENIIRLCERKYGIGADGLILLKEDITCDFEMKYYNSNGIEGSFCGNGGRCVVSLAHELNLIDENAKFRFQNSYYHAEREGKTIKLSMGNVAKIDKLGNSTFFLNTGSPHYIKILSDINYMDVVKEGRKIRFNNKYKEIGVNVNFVSVIDQNSIRVRTYERGVENETLSCGTGVTAAAIAVHYSKLINSDKIQIYSNGGILGVQFKKTDYLYSQVYLIGETKIVYEGFIFLEDLKQ